MVLRYYRLPNQQRPDGSQIIRQEREVYATVCKLVLVFFFKGPNTLLKRHSTSDHMIRTRKF